MTETKKLIINVPSGLHRDLKTMAFMDETTMTEIVLKEIVNVIAEYRKRPAK